jgi:hypothetical protein
MILPDDGFLERSMEFVNDMMKDMPPFEGEFIPIEGLNPEWEPRYRFADCEENGSEE